MYVGLRGVIIKIGIKWIKDTLGRFDGGDIVRGK